MPGDYSRKRFDPKKHYSAVLEQQGRVQLDADWNEQADILQYRISTEAIDVIGKTGVPEKNGGFAISLLENGDDLGIAPGRIYVDGLLFELEAGTATYRHQPYYLNPDLSYFNAPSSPASPASPPDPSLKNGTYIVYLEAWQRERNFLDDPNIREVALGEADTTTRLQNVWRVKLLKTADNAAATCKTSFSEWDSLTAAPTGRLSAQTIKNNDQVKPCVLPPGGGYLGLENQLYRVQVLKGGDKSTATFTWSRDNGSIETGIITVSGTVLTVTDIGKDDILGFANGQWVEMVETEPSVAGHTLVQIDTVNEDTQEIFLKTDVSSYNGKTGLKLRRWDLSGDALQNGIGMQAGWTDIESGVQVLFSAGTYKAGDYWMIPARTAIADIEWPVDGLQLPVAQPPTGIQRHYCRLALLNVTAGQATLTDCRSLFPSLTDICAEDICFTNSTCNFPGVTNVQQALDMLCQRSGSCTLVAKPGKNWEKVFDTLADGMDAQICFQAGLYPLDKTIVLANKGNLKFTGCGSASQIIIANAEAAIVLDHCKEVTIRELYAEGGTAAGSKTASPKNLNGVFTCISCTAVNIEHVSVKSGSATVRTCTCITVRNDAGTPCPVRIGDCDLRVADRQQGILLVNTTACWIERNNIHVYTKSAAGIITRPVQVGIRNVLASNLRAGAIGKTAAANNVSVSSGKFVVNFKTDQSLKKEWQQALTTTYPVAAASEEELMSRVQALSNRLVSDQKLQTGLKQFGLIIKSALTLNRAVAAQGITIGGQVGKDIRIADNIITGVLQGIHAGLSHKVAAGTAPDILGNLSICGNSIAIVLPRAIGKQDRYGIFVGSCNNLLMENNNLTLERINEADNTAIDGIRVWGNLGPRLMITKNLVAALNGNQKVSFDNGINVNPLQQKPGNAQWVVMWNVAPAKIHTVRVVNGAVAVQGTNTP